MRIQGVTNIPSAYKSPSAQDDLPPATAYATRNRIQEEGLEDATTPGPTTVKTTPVPSTPSKLQICQVGAAPF